MITQRVQNLNKIKSKSMNNVVKIKDKKTGETLTAVYAPNRKGNLVYHVNGVALNDKVFDRKYEIVN